MPDRPTMDRTLIDVARVFARRGTCSRGQTGCVLALDGRVVASGYNGAPAGLKHCDHTCDCDAYRRERAKELVLKNTKDIAHHTTCNSWKPCRIAVHAEANAIAFAARHGVATNGTTLYTLYAPCRACAALIINAGVVRVVTTEDMPPVTGETSVGSGVDLLQAAGIQVKVGRSVREGVA